MGWLGLANSTNFIGVTTPNRISQMGSVPTKKIPDKSPLPSPQTDVFSDVNHPPDVIISDPNIVKRFAQLTINPDHMRPFLCWVLLHTYIPAIPPVIVMTII